MNEWESIRFIFGRRFKTAMTTFLITMVATVTLDLTQAILIGAFVSGAVFLSQSANINITVQNVDPVKLRERGIENEGKCKHVQVAYLTGPLFFAATGHFHEAFAHLNNIHALILSMRGVPVVDTSGLQAMDKLYDDLTERGGTLMLAAVHDDVRIMLERGGLLAKIGADNVFWSADRAIVAAEQRACAYCAQEIRQ